MPVDTPAVQQLRGTDLPTAAVRPGGRVRTEEHDPADINGLPDAGARLRFLTANWKLSPVV